MTLLDNNWKPLSNILNFALDKSHIMEKLNIDEILVLKWKAVPVSQIAKMGLAEFDKMYDQDRDEVERLIDKANSIFDRQQALGIMTLSVQDENYPIRLKEIGNEAPSLIHCLGNVDLLKEEKAISVIGARAAGKEGLDAAYNLGKKYAEAGFVIVSGLALGCDKAAHEGCLNAGGKTIAIVGSGLDIIHPIENSDLQRRILEAGGLILSEQLLKQKASPRTLVARNRLQAALSLSVILAECPIKSGSMYTMNFARGYNKKCYAVIFTKRTETNAGNFYLIDNNLAEPLTL